MPGQSRALRRFGLAASVAVFGIGVTQTPLPTSGVDLPTTRPGALLGHWLTLCQRPNLQQLTTWLAANLSREAAKRQSAESRAKEDLDFCTMHGPFRIVRVTKSEPTTIILLGVGSKSDIWFALGLDANGSGEVNGTGRWPDKPPESAMPRDLSDAAIAAEVKARVARLSNLGLFSGIVTAARGTEVIARATGGYADRARRTAITGSTQFTIGSMGKMFTAVSIGQLVDQKRISFDDPVGKFFADYPNQTVRDNATVGMLLSHTSGLRDFLSKRTPEMMKNGVKRAAEFMPLYDKDEPAFPPGTRWSYSNAGLALAGAIVEKVSGEDYPDYVRKHVFAVAGMTDSDPNNIPLSSARLVIPYTKGPEQSPSAEWREAEHDIGSPAGGAISTADDLIRFADALRGGRLVSHATFEEMVRPKPNSPNYGYGLGIEEMYGRTLIGHTGGFPGVSTLLATVLNSDYTVVALANQDPPAEAYARLWVVPLIAEKAKLEK